MPRRPCRVRPPRSAFAGFRFPPDVIIVAIYWYLPAMDSPTETSRNCWPNVGSLSITSRFIGGCSDPPRCSSTRLDPAGTLQVIGGSSTKPCATRRGVTERG
jgi:hypothetical protein